MAETDNRTPGGGVAGPIDVSDRCSRLLGMLCFAGGPIDPRAIRALTFLTDSVDVTGSSVAIIAPSNPIIDYQVTTNLGSGSSSIHTYTATGNLKVSGIEASASGAMKIEIKTGNLGSETTKLIAFTSETNLTAQLRFHEELQLTAGQTIQVILTNRESEDMDVYSTVLGFNM